MKTHATAETLSAYLDHELVESEAAELEAHLQSCPACAQRLAGMRGVVHRLNHLERMAPPSTLDQMVARRIALAGESRSFADRIESSLGAFQRQSNLFMLFCVVIALAVITVLFAHALQVASQGNIPVVFEGPSTPVTIPVGETPSESSGDGDGGVREGEEVTLGQRTFVREDGGWSELGVGIDQDTDQLLQLDWQSQAARDLVEAEPTLAELRALGGGPILVQIDDRVVVLK